jgi:hypothetical protein
MASSATNPKEAAMRLKKTALGVLAGLAVGAASAQAADVTAHC